MGRYLAFISYRHKEPDQHVSQTILRGIEGYHLPAGSGLPLRRRVFRDTDELPTGIDLGANIEGALDESEWLIALCSKDYMKSNWCLMEVQHFLKAGRKDRILPVLLSDTPEEAMPEEIRDIPLAADLRADDLSCDRRKAAGAVPALLARMSGEMAAEDFAAAERRFRWKSGAGAAGFVLAGILGFAAYALHTANVIAEGNVQIRQATEEAEKARLAAEEERNEALLKNAQHVAQQAMFEYNAGNDDEAIRMALSVLPEGPEDDTVPLSYDALGVLRIAMSRPKDTYRFDTAAETSFDISGCIPWTVSELLLLGEPQTETESSAAASAETAEEAENVNETVNDSFLNYETGEISERESEPRKQALEEGFSRAYYLQSYGTVTLSMDRILCGPEKPAEFIISKDKREALTIAGEPFYMDSFTQEPTGDIYFAWLEHPAEGQKQRAALFAAREGEAIAEMELDGAPLSAEFSADYVMHTELAVIDQSNTLRFYYTSTGELKTEVPGKWSSVHYPDEKFRVCAAAADGSGWSLLDTGSGEVLLTVPTPSPVRQMLYCENKSALLVCCDDGVRVYDLESGRLQNEFLTEEPPRFALWGNADGGRFSYDGNTIVIIFRNRVETWRLETTADMEQTDVIPLFEKSIYNWCEKAFYSKDGKKIYLQMKDGTIAAFDTSNGEFLWANKGDWMPNGSHYGSMVTEDGTAIWRMEDMERIDAETGESIYRVEKGGGQMTPSEDPRIGLAVVPALDWDCARVFDLNTGEVLWEDDVYRTGWSFSEEGLKARNISILYGKDAHVQEVRWCLKDARTGETEKEECLLRLDGTDVTYYKETLPGQRYAAIYPSTVVSIHEEGLPIYVFDLVNGTLTGEAVSPGPAAEVYFSDGGDMMLRWMDEESAREGWELRNGNREEDRYRYCCRLYPDGTLGETVPTHSPEGKKLSALQSQVVVFAGEEAILDTVQIDRSHGYQSYSAHQLRRFSDDTVLLDAGENNIAATPAGGSVCIYNDSVTHKFTPVLLLDSDPWSLIRKAQRRLGVQP